MALSIVHGPPNSGRAGVVRERFLAALGRDPVLVVPTFDDVVAFGRELCPAGGALLGGQVTTFDGLFREVAEATEAAPVVELTPAQRLRLHAGAVARARPRILRASAQRPGFAPALEELVSELQAAEVPPARLAESAGDLTASALLTEVAGLYAAYEMLRDEADRGDAARSAAGAIAALRARPEAWRARPVLVYGFDDLTGQQQSLVETLAGTTEVTVGVTFEDRDSLAARSELIARLRDAAGRDPSADVATHANPANTESPLLFALERGFLEPEAPPSDPDDSLRLLRCAGERSEAEAVGGEIARLLDAGAAPDSIAIAVRDVHARGPLIGRVLQSYGIPVAVEADLPLSETATGAALAGLLRATQQGAEAMDLLAYLRAPGRSGGNRADQLERTLRRRAILDVAQAEEMWVEMEGGNLEPLEKIREAGDDRRRIAAVVADAALDISQYPLKRDGRQGEIATPEEALELRAGATIAAALEEIAELDECLPDPAELAGLIDGMTLRLWSGPATGRVRVASPYRLRALRFDTVFVVSLQDGEFPSHRSGGPFLSDEQRAAAGLRERPDTEAEERYLFHICLSLPRRRLVLSHRYCDDEGKTLSPSPYLDDVASLLTAPAEEVTRSLADVVFAPSDSPSAAELGRALAAERRTEAPPALTVDPGLAAALNVSLVEAAAYQPKPGPLTDALVLGELGERDLYGASTLEDFAGCSYRWFVGHELGPKPLDPDGDQLAYGGAVHAALEDLYRRPPAEGTRPADGTLDAWLARGHELLDEKLADRHPSTSAAARIGRRNLHGLLEDYLRRDARRRDQFETKILEASFGRDEEDEVGPLDLGGWSLHGKIDRIDVDAQHGLALVHDYKVGKRVTQQSGFERRRTLQMALYMRAVGRLWDRVPIAGMYHPLGLGPRGVPRGLGNRDERDESLEELALPKADWLPAEQFEERLARAQELGDGIVKRMRSGDIDRDPLEGRCPPFCTFAPICRLDRRAETGGEQPVRGNGGGE